MWIKAQNGALVNLDLVFNICVLGSRDLKERAVWACSTSNDNDIRLFVGSAEECNEYMITVKQVLSAERKLIKVC